MIKKIGLVISGGGNRCGAAAGAVHALSVVHGIDDPYVIVCVSGGTEPALRYMAGRFDEMYEWPRLFASRKYLCRWRFWRMMDIDVLVDEILSPQIPNLHWEATRTASRIFIAATELPDGCVHWFMNEDVLRHKGKLKKASAAVPGVYAKEVVIGGRRFIDGSFSVTLTGCIEKAFREGADKVIVIDTQKYGFNWAAKWILRALSWRQGKEVRLAVRRFLEQEEKPIQSSERVVVCRPEPLAIRHALDTYAKHTAEGIKQGYAAMAALKI